MKVKSLMEYTQLEYIEGTGSQFIDTNFLPNQNTRMVLDIDIGTQSSYPTALLGGRNGNTSSNASFVIFIMTASQFRTDFGSATVNANITTSGRFLIDKNKTVCTINGTAYTNTAATFQSNYTLSILTENDPSGYDTRITKGKIYSCQVYDNDVLIRNYVPAMDTNGVVCLYDKVNHEFVYNAGTGDFVAGSVVKELGSEVWEDAQKYYIKTADNTWTQPQSVYVKVTENLTMLDSITSSGTQWIDTGFYPTYATRVVMDVSDVPASANYLFGTRDTTSSTAPNQFGFYRSTSTAIRSDYFGTNQSATVSDTTIRTTIDKNRNITTAYGETLTNTSVTSGESTYTLWLFGLNNVGASTVLSTMTLYSCQIYDNDILVRDYIPVLDSNGIACLYDKVTMQCFYNQGTGSFTAGYKTEFDANIDLPFLASTGTQYIDTGFKPNQDTRVVMSAEITESTGSTALCLFGTRKDYSTLNYSMVYDLSNKMWTYNYGSLHTSYDDSTPVGEHNIDANKANGVFDGNIMTHSAASFSCAYNLYLFAINNAGTAQWTPYAKLYSCKVYDNGILVRDYIPKTDTSGVPALYDKVSQTYYYNQGTGSFGSGTILKRPYWKQVA